jgi:predicted DNA-binding ribbon-helix-helix protein
VREHLRKRSFRLAGHRTSIALEPEFWAVIEAAARREGVSVAGLVGRVDASRADPDLPLASALRVFALRAASGQGVEGGAGTGVGLPARSAPPP